MTPLAPLNIPLAGLLTDGSGEVRRFDLKGVSIPLDDGASLETPIDGTLDIARTNRGILVDARLSTSLRATCSRCLGLALIPLVIDIREEVLPSLDPLTGGAIDQSAEPDATRLNGHHELELESFLRDAVSLASPIAPLCGPDCAGLCVECGEPLGPGHRLHEGGDIDPRLAALKAFRFDADAENE